MILQEGWYGSPQEVGFRFKIGIKNGQELSPGLGRSMTQGSGLESGPVRPADRIDMDAAGLDLFDDPVDESGSLVGGIIQDLNFQPVGGIIEPGGSPDDSLGHIFLIIDRYLDRHRRPFPVRDRPGRQPIGVQFTGAGAVVDQQVDIQTVQHQKDRGQGINSEDGCGKY